MSRSPDHPIWGIPPPPGSPHFTPLTPHFTPRCTPLHPTRFRLSPHLTPPSGGARREIGAPQLVILNERRITRVKDLNRAKRILNTRSVFRSPDHPITG